MASWRGGGYISGMFPSTVISISVTRHSGCNGILGISTILSLTYAQMLSKRMLKCYHRCMLKWLLPSLGSLVDYNFYSRISYPG